MDEAKVLARTILFLHHSTCTPQEFQDLAVKLARLVLEKNSVAEIKFAELSSSDKPL